MNLHAHSWGFTHFLEIKFVNLSEGYDVVERPAFVSPADEREGERKKVESEEERRYAWVGARECV